MTAPKRPELPGKLIDPEMVRWAMGMERYADALEAEGARLLAVVRAAIDEGHNAAHEFCTESCLICAALRRLEETK